MLLEEILHSILDSLDDYCILHDWQNLPEKIKSDLDIIICKKQLILLNENLVKLAKARIIQNLRHESTCNYFIIAYEKYNKHHFVAIDAATDYRRNGLVIFSANELLKGKRQHKGFWIASPESELNYILAKKILKNKIDNKAKIRLVQLSCSLGNTAITESEKIIGNSSAKRVIPLISKQSWKEIDERLPKLRYALIKHIILKNPFSPIAYFIPEMIRIIHRIVFPTGLFLSVLGPDGSGKTTLIEYLKIDLEGAFRQTNLYHLRPYFFGKSQNKTACQPHNRKCYPKTISLLKLIYYWLDYIFGYLIKIKVALIRSRLVIFDRYFDDILVDPKRLRLRNSEILSKFLYFFVPKPDITFLLDAPPVIIFKRKQEVILEEVTRQRELYKIIAQRSSSYIIVDGSKNAREVAKKCIDVIIDHLNKRYLARNT